MTYYNVRVKVEVDSVNEVANGQVLANQAVSSIIRGMNTYIPDGNTVVKIIQVLDNDE